MEQRSPIVGCGRPQMGGFNVRHAPSISAETNATVMIYHRSLRFSDSYGRPPKSADERDRREPEGDERAS